MVPQTELSTPEVAEEEKEQEEMKEEVSMQSHNELTSNPAFLNIELQKNEKGEVSVKGKHELDEISSRKKKNWQCL